MPMSQARHFLLPTALPLALVAVMASGVRAQEQQAPAAEGEKDTYEQNEIFKKASDFFGGTTEGLAKAIEKVFAEKGRPNAYVAGEEVSGAIGIGVRYGNGELNRKSGEARKVYWQGPSIGFDLGGNASKVFVLIYHLP